MVYVSFDDLLIKYMVLASIKFHLREDFSDVQSFRVDILAFGFRLHRVKKVDQRSGVLVLYNHTGKGTLYLNLCFLGVGTQVLLWVDEQSAQLLGWVFDWNQF